MESKEPVKSERETFFTSSVVVTVTRSSPSGASTDWGGRVKITRGRSSETTTAAEEDGAEGLPHAEYAVTRWKSVSARANAKDADRPVVSRESSTAAKLGLSDLSIR